LETKGEIQNPVLDLEVKKFYYLFFGSMGFELRVSCLLGRHYFCLRYSSALFCVAVFFKIGSWVVFAQGWLQTANALISAS
jgi:hypothetical protein